MYISCFSELFIFHIINFYPIFEFSNKKSLMEILFLIIGIIIGAIVAWLLANKQLSIDFDAKKQKLFKQFDIEKERRINAEAQLNALQQQDVNGGNRIKDTIEAAAVKALGSNSKAFMNLAQQTMEKYMLKASSDLNHNKETIAQMLDPLKEKLDKHEALVKELENHSSKTFGSLKTYLVELGKSQQRLAREASALSTALKAPRVRGRWGEIGLKRIVEFSGMSSYCDFEEQVHVENNDKRYRPDMIVNLPDNKRIVIDSKVPLNAFLEAIETGSEAERKELTLKHTKAVERHVKELSSKSYWSQFDDSVDFVVLYIEVEPAFALAMATNKNLVLDAIKNKIVFATPTTLITLLQTVSYSWKQHTATENALEIWKSAREFYNRMAIFGEYMNKVGIGLNNLNKTYNQAVGSWENRVIPGIKKLESLGITKEKRSVNSLSQIETTPRELK